MSHWSKHFQRLTTCCSVWSLCLCSVMVLAIPSPNVSAQDAALEQPETESAAQTKFNSLDVDADQLLSVSEFQNCEKKTPAILKRDFLVFDRDANQSLSFQEFRSVAYLVSIEERQQTHSFIEMSDQYFANIQENWLELDKAADASITEVEFGVLAIDAKVPGLEGTRFADWDINHDQGLTLEEIRKTIDIAFGNHAVTGEILRRQNGDVADLRFYDLLIKSAGVIAKDDYVKRHGLPFADAEKLFIEIDVDADQKLSLKEFLNDSKIWFNPIDRFLAWDTDLDGSLNAIEIEKADMAPGQRVHLYQSLPVFDLDQNGTLQLQEFQFTPVVNPHTTWVWATDTNEDAVLDDSEFVFSQSIYLKGLTQFYFQQLDQDHNQLLGLGEWNFKTNHPQLAFRNLDGNGDQHLSLQEFVSNHKAISLFTRDFGVLDFDGDQQLTYDEYASHPTLVPRRHRTPVPDPVLKLIEKQIEGIERGWKVFDNDESGTLSEVEFDSIEEVKGVVGLSAATFNDWDIDKDSSLTLAEIRSFLDIAFGVTYEGVLLRYPHGSVVDLRTYLTLKDAATGISSAKFALSRSTLPKEEVDKTIMIVDKNSDQVLSLSEWAASERFISDSLGLFFTIDTNFDGKISTEEMDLAKLPAGQKSMTPGTVIAFDEDGDGSLSYLEFRLIPAMNLLAIWIQANDLNGDGELTLNEFFQSDTFELNALTGHFFQKLDRNQDGKLLINEWPFLTAHPRIKFRQADVNDDGIMTKEEFKVLNLGNLERLRRDFLIVDFDHTHTLTYDEFLQLPSLVPKRYRTKLPVDPVQLHVDDILKTLLPAFHREDRDKNGSLSLREFEACKFDQNRFRYLTFNFQAYDVDRDSEVSLNDFQTALKSVFGIVTRTGIPLRRDSGEVLDLREFLSIDKDRDEQYSLQDYLESTPGKANQNPQATFNALDQDANRKVSLEEWSLREEVWVTPISRMQSLDVDMDGHLEDSDFKQALLPSSQKKLARFMFPTFDIDHNSNFDLNDFRMTPLVNLLEPWGTERDTDYNGTLSFEEFSAQSQIEGLRAFYFDLLDLDRNKQLDVNEWSFEIDFAQVSLEVAFELKDADHSGTLTFEELIGLPKVPQPGTSFNPQQEKLVMRAEEAFRRADLSGDSLLDKSEFVTDAGREVIAPGASTLKRKLAQEPQAEDIPLMAILGFNAVMISTFLVFLFRKKKKEGMKNGSVTEVNT